MYRDFGGGGGWRAWSAPWSGGRWWCGAAEACVRCQRATPDIGRRAGAVAGRRTICGPDICEAPALTDPCHIPYTAPGVCMALPNSQRE